MNNKYIYLPISFLVLICIGLLSMEIPYFSQMIGFLRLLLFAFIISIVFSSVIYRKYKSVFDGENMYTLIGLSWLCSFVVLLTSISIINRKYATFNCEVASYKVLDYEGRYTSGYGNTKKGKLEANQWILKLEIDNDIRQFVFEKDILTNGSVTRRMDFEFCKGIPGTSYFNSLQ